jgi:quercetin dioxygenase-like cupin family protein
MIKHLLMGTFVLASLVSSADAGIGLAVAAGPSTKAEINRQVLERAAIGGTDEELRLMLIEYPPSASAPVHRHPVIGLCYVIEGTAESQYEGEPVKTFRAGDSYQDSATKKHLIFRNPSTTSPLRFTCSAKIGKGQEFAQPVP